MNKLKLTEKAFLHGSWNTYLMEDCNLLASVTPYEIKKNLNVFNEDYRVKSEFIILEELVCFQLILEEKPEKQNRPKKKKGHKKQDKIEKEIIHSFKIAASIEDHLLFSSSSIAFKFREELAKVFEAGELVPYNLSGSPPYELLLFHRQAANSSKDLALMTDRLHLDVNMVGEEFTRNQVYEELGTDQSRVPKMKKLSGKVENMPVKQDEHGAEKFTLKRVEFELQCDSALDMYISLAKKGIVERAPDWVVACRRAGKTHRNIKYS